jgi:hypothetical protein
MIIFERGILLGSAGERSGSARPLANRHPGEILPVLAVNWNTARGGLVYCRL